MNQQLIQAQQDWSQVLKSFFVVSTAAVPFSLMNCLSCSSLNRRKTKTISILTLEQCFSFSRHTWASEKVSTDFPRSLLRKQSKTIHGKQRCCCLLLFALEGRSTCGSRVEKGNEISSCSYRAPGFTSGKQLSRCRAEFTAGK